MATFCDRPKEAAREGSDSSVSQPHALEGVGKHILNQYVPPTCGSKVVSHNYMLVYASFTWEQLDKEEASRNENRL